MFDFVLFARRKISAMLTTGLLLGGAVLIAACATPNGAPVRSSGTGGTYEPLKRTGDDTRGNMSYRIVESTRAFLRGLPETRNQPTLYERPDASGSDSGRSGRGARVADDGRVRVGLLLPSGATDEGVRAVAADLFNAAQLALFDVDRAEITLLVKDTQGTPKGAARAARAAIREGAQLLIGPVFGASARAVAPIARQASVPTIAFSNDRAVAGDGVWLIGFLPEQNLERIIEVARLQGLERFAALIPQTTYGERIEAALGPALQRYGGELVQIEYYQEEAQSMFDPVQKLAQYEDRKLAWTEEKTRLLEEAQLLFPEIEEKELMALLAEQAPELHLQLEDLSRRETFGELPYDAVLMPEGGIKLRSLAPLLPYFDVDPREIRFLGTGLWDDPQLGQEPPLIGGWYAAPTPGGWNAFAKRFEKVYGHNPRRIASLAYDGISLAAALAAINNDRPFTAQTLTNADGFLGIDGIFRLNANGMNERGLAVLEIRRRKNRLVTEAPDSFVAIDRAAGQENRFFAPIAQRRKEAPETPEIQFLDQSSPADLPETPDTRTLPDAPETPVSDGAITNTLTDADIDADIDAQIEPGIDVDIEPEILVAPTNAPTNRANPENPASTTAE